MEHFTEFMSSYNGQTDEEKAAFKSTFNELDIEADNIGDILASGNQTDTLYELENLSKDNLESVLSTLVDRGCVEFPSEDDE